VDEVGIERGDGPVVDALLQAGLTVLVIAPGQVKNLRSRYGSAGNKDDRFDAYVLADVVRTDRARLRPWSATPPRPPPCAPTVRARRDMVEHRVAAANQLRAHLQLVFPGAASLFAAIDTAISLCFLERFTTQTQADWLSVKRLESWLRSVSHSGRTDPAVLHARLLAAPRGTTGSDADIHAATTKAYVALLRVLNTQITTLEYNLTAQLKTTPTPTSTRPCRGSRPCAPPGCSPRSATPVASSPPPTPWPPWPV
jgi:transposase